MPNESTVSTEETPQARETINVVTEENQAQASTPPPAEPPPGAPNTETPATSETPPAKPKTRRRSSERKIAALQRQLAEAETAGTARDVEMAALRAQVDTLSQQQSAPPAQKPRLQDFKTAEEYAEAHAGWKAGQEPPAPPPPAAAAPPAPPQTTTPPTYNPEVRDLITKGAELYDDFEEVLTDNSLPFSPAMADHVFDSDRGPDLVMWLDENREDAQEIFHLRPKKMAARFAEIEKNLDTPPAPTPPTAPPAGKSVSKQPDPPAPPGEPVGGNVQHGATEIREGLPMDDYASRRRAQMAKNRTR